MLRNNNEYPATFAGTAEGRMYVGAAEPVPVSFEIWRHPSGMNIPMMKLDMLTELAEQSIGNPVRGPQFRRDDITSVVAEREPGTCWTVEDGRFVERPTISDRDSLDQFMKDSFDGVFSPVPTESQMAVAGVLLFISIWLLIGWLIFGRGG